MGVRKLLIWEVRGRICFIRKRVFGINDVALSIYHMACWGLGKFCGNVLGARFTAWPS